MRIFPRKKSRAGFTLIELVITVAVVAILAAIAVPSYNEHVRKSRRAQAKADLSEMQQCMERFNTANGTYTGGAAICQLAATDRYGYTINVASRSAFTITAVPSGGQSGDYCGTLGLNQAGQKTNSAGTGCWN